MYNNYTAVEAEETLNSLMPLDPTPGKKRNCPKQNIIILSKGYC